MSSTIDVTKFNEFLGPLCDFYTSFPGALKPYSIDFFRIVNEKVPRSHYSLYDTRFVEQTFECMNTSYKNEWKSDLKKVEVEMERNEQDASNKKNREEKKVQS